MLTEGFSLPKILIVILEPSCISGVVLTSSGCIYRFEEVNRAEPLLFKCSLLPFRQDSFSRSLSTNLTNLHYICTHIDLSSLFVSATLLPTLSPFLEMMPQVVILGA